MAMPSLLFPGYLNRDYNGFSSLMYYCTVIYCSYLIGPLLADCYGLGYGSVQNSDSFRCISIDAMRVMYCWKT